MTFSHTPDEALVEDRAKACVREEINSVYWEKLDHYVIYIILNRMRSLHVLFQETYSAKW